jgi:hypothetical protein
MAKVLWIVEIFAAKSRFFKVKGFNRRSQRVWLWVKLIDEKSIPSL